MQINIAVDMVSFRAFGNEGFGHASGRYLNLTKIGDGFTHLLTIGNSKQDLTELSFKLHSMMISSGFGFVRFQIAEANQKAEINICKYPSTSEGQNKFSKDVDLVTSVLRKINGKIKESCQKHSVFLSLFEQLPRLLPQDSQTFLAEKELAAGCSDNSASVKDRDAQEPREMNEISDVRCLDTFAEFAEQIDDVKFLKLMRSKILNEAIVYQAFYIPVIDPTFCSINARVSVLFLAIISSLLLAVLAVGSLKNLVFSLVPCIGEETLAERVLNIVAIPIMLIFNVFAVVRRALGVVIHPRIALMAH
jgi:hypothetical protein